MNQHGGPSGKWMKSLPPVLQTLSAQWDLSEVMPVKNMTWNYVAKAQSSRLGPVVIKICEDHKGFQDELKAIKHFSGHGMVKLLHENQEHHALLLEQLTPGDSLLDLQHLDDTEIIRAYGSVVKKLSSAPAVHDQDFPHMRQWLEALDRADKAQFPRGMLNQVAQLKEKLLATSKNEMLLHGDLHHDNILKSGNGWRDIAKSCVWGFLREI